MLYKTMIIAVLAGAISCLAHQARAQESRSIHGGAWPIQGGVKHQPTRGAVGGEFTLGQQNETDKLYDELMNGYGATHHPGNIRSR